jgi:hypothetical protein
MEKGGSDNEWGTTDSQDSLQKSDKAIQTSITTSPVLPM